MVGLGNPGAEYARTRHNAGYWLVEELLRRHGGTWRRESRCQSQLARTRIGDTEVWLQKPLTFMNASGAAVGSLVRFQRIEPGAILVAHDEIDLPPGTVRLKQGGGHGGHNGLRDIIAQIGPGFWRLRMGVGHPGSKEQVIDYVLERPPAAEREQIEAALARALDLVPDLLRNGTQKAMQALHTRDHQDP
ncbi:MAG: aminoacyl-tRNA hydrolase [Gammaproteobacteria bacterium]|nr:aminoacyl-tRNA hydrolase [Gammaproteobacteria bacterium]